MAMQRLEEICEPRLHFLRRQISLLSRIAETLAQGSPATIDGLRLRSTEAWADQPATITGSLGASGYCNCDCVFCYERGNPLPYAQTPKFTGIEEARTWLRLYKPDDGRGLASKRTLYREPFLNPDFMTILAEIRKHNATTPITGLTTSGSFLTEDVVCRLAELSPLLITLSINSADPKIRQNVMRDRVVGGTEVALGAPGLLHKHGIPYLGSIVAYPSIPVEDIGNTLRFLSDHQSLAARVMLYGFTQFNQMGYSEEEVRDYSVRVTDLVRRVRTELPLPILCHPSLTWEEPLVPEIAGVCRNSPAHRAGVRTGDLVRLFNGRQVLTRAHLRGLLRKHMRDEPHLDIRLAICRQGQELEIHVPHLTLKAEDDYYPYKPKGYHEAWTNWLGEFMLPGGFAIIQDFHAGYLRDLVRVLDKHVPETPALIVSKTIQRAYHRALEMFPPFAEALVHRNIELVVPTSEFWGGNVDVMDLFCISDIVKAIKRHYRSSLPDRIILPSSGLDPWGFDLVGAHYLDIYWLTGVPVTLLQVERIQA